VTHRKIGFPPVKRIGFPTPSTPRPGAPMRVFAETIKVDDGVDLVAAIVEGGNDRRKLNQ
jgi:hypothetical protein